MSLAAALLLTATAAVAAPPEQPSAPPEVHPRQMSSSEIRAHNANLEASDPNFIRCERVGQMGSLIQRRRDCRTNAQWDAAFIIGNDNVRETADAMRSKAASGN